MAKINTDNLTPMELGRLNKALDKLYRFDGVVCTLRQQIELMKGEKREWDGMCDWNRHKFNSMDYKQQKEYEAKLKARRYFTIDGTIVPKIVFDCVN